MMGNSVALAKRIARALLRRPQPRVLPPCPPPFDSLTLSSYGLCKLIEDFSFDTVLDVGSGAGEHAQIMCRAGKKVTAIDLGKSVSVEKKSADYEWIFDDYHTHQFEKPFDAIWASHVLEHQPNPSLFIKKLFADCRDGGIVAITVPPLKHEIVGGHLSLWNGGLLLYNIVMAGYDCREAALLKYGYNISVIVEKRSIKRMPELAYDSGDIEKLLEYFPPGLNEPFDGDIDELNWF